jgi:hypothetical protein
MRFIEWLFFKLNSKAYKKVGECMNIFRKIDILLMDLREELEEQQKKCKLGSPISFEIRGKLKMLEEIEARIEELKNDEVVNRG